MVRSILCPDSPSKFLRCSKWTGSWYLRISKTDGKLTIVCKNLQPITVSGVVGACKIPIADSNFAWVKFSGFRKNWYEPHVRGEDQKSFTLSYFSFSTANIPSFSNFGTAFI